MLLFLDFDGVLHPEYHEICVPDDVAFCHLPRFEVIMREYPSVEIIISTSWRTILNLECLRRYFSTDISQRVIGVTPILADENSYQPALREKEILAWLVANQRTAEKWIAVDDRTWQFVNHRAQLVACVGYRGLDEEAGARLRLALEQIQDSSNP